MIPGSLARRSAVSTPVEQQLGETSSPSENV